MRRAFGWSVVGVFLFALSGCGGGSSTPVAGNTSPAPGMPSPGMPGPSPAAPGPAGAPDPGATMPTMPDPAASAGGATPGAPGYPTPGDSGYPGANTTPGAPGYPTPGAGYSGPGARPGAPGADPMPPIPGDNSPAPPGIPTPDGVPGGIEGPGYGPPGAPGYGVGGDYGNGPNLPKSFQEAAEQAFKSGRDRDGFQLLYARTLAELKADDASGINMRYIAGLTRPAAVLRWGIGVQYFPQRGYEGAPPELGKPPQGGEATGNDPANPGGGGNGREGRRPRFGNRQPGSGGPGAPGIPGGPGAPGDPGGASGGGPPAEPQAMLHYYTGELGDKVLERLRKNASKGMYGELHKAFVGPAKVGGLGGPDGGPGLGRGPGMMPMPVGGIAGPGAGAPGYGSGESGAAGGSKDAGVGQLAAGIVMLGNGTAKDLLDKAREEEVELLLVFEVSAVRTRTGKESGDTKIRLVDPVGGKDLYTSKKLNNIQVYDAREKPGARGADPIDDVVELLFKAVDEKNYKLSDLPATLTAEHVQSRYDKLMAQEHDNPLPVLVELRHYYRLKLLPGKLMFEGYKKLLGDEKADQLAKGKIEQKREALADWLPDGLTIAAAGAATAPPGASAPGGYPPGGSTTGYVPPGAAPPGSAPPGSAPPGISSPPGPGAVPPGLSTPSAPGVGLPGSAPAPVAPGAGSSPVGLSAAPGVAGGAATSPMPTSIPAPGAPGPQPTPPGPGTGKNPAAPGSAPPASGAQKFEIPGSSLSLPVPSGFTLGADEHGPVLSNGTAVIRAKRDERPFKTAVIDYSAENLTKSGFTLSEKQDLGQFSVVRAIHSASKKNFVFAIVPDSETSVLVISASFAPEDEARLAPAIMSAAAGLQIGK